MALLQYQKNKGRQISDNFHSSEFNCSCDQCSITIVDSSLVEKLELLRSSLGSSLSIHSGYRCAHKQQQLRIQGYDTAVGTSSHERGQAADVGNGVTPGHELEDLARKAGFRAVGTAPTWIHVDTRDDKDRKWSYKK